MRRGGAVKSKDFFLFVMFYYNRLVKVNQYNITHPP